VGLREERRTSGESAWLDHYEAWSRRLDELAAELPGTTSGDAAAQLHRHLEEHGRRLRRPPTPRTQPAHDQARRACALYVEAGRLAADGIEAANAAIAAASETLLEAMEAQALAMQAMAAIEV
jgi:hypothetical protein